MFSIQVTSSRTFAKTTTICHQLELFNLSLTFEETYLSLYALICPSIKCIIVKLSSTHFSSETLREEFGGSRRRRRWEEKDILYLTVLLGAAEYA